MEKSIGVSVLIITYNQKEYISDAIKGALSQKTNFDFEVIIHDDASTDGTTEIVKQFEKEYPDQIVAYYEEINMFPQWHLYIEKILSKARGKYLALCDGDDYWCDSNKLQLQYDFLEKNQEFSLCVHNTKIINLLTKEEYLFGIEETKELSRNEVVLKAGSIFHSSSHFFRLESWYVKHGGRDFLDMERVLWLCNEGRVMYFSDVMSVYRLNTKGSWTESLKGDYSLILDFMTRLIYFEKFDKETGGRWKKELKDAENWILECVYVLLRKKYCAFTLKRKIVRWLEMTIDLFCGKKYVTKKVGKIINEKNNKESDIKRNV